MNESADDRAHVTPNATGRVRSYVRVADIERAVESAVQLGAMVAFGPVEIPGRGRIAIYIHGGVERGLWEVSRAATRRDTSSSFPQGTRSAAPLVATTPAIQDDLGCESS
jgi:hypothetical protein